MSQITVVISKRDSYSTAYINSTVATAIPAPTTTHTSATTAAATTAAHNLTAAAQVNQLRKKNLVISLAQKQSRYAWFTGHTRP